MTHSGESSYHLDMAQPGTLEQVVETYARPLIRYAYTILGSMEGAEDAMEDAIAALCVRGGRFRTPEMLRDWLYKTTRNKALDQLRRRKREVPLVDLENVLQCLDAEQDVLLRQRNRQLYRCMQALPQQYREVLTLAYFEDMDTQQICIVLRKNSKQVYNLLARAKAALKELLTKEGITCEDLR